MAIVKKKKLASSSASSQESEAQPETMSGKSISLSKEKFVPSDSLFDYNILIYGERKIGKTTLAAECPNAYFFMFEPNDSYELYKSDIMEWWEFVRLSSEFLNSKHNFKTAIVDTGRPCYQMALAHACKRHGFTHPGGQNDHGAAWSKVTKEFDPPLRQLMNSKYGFIVLAHEYGQEITTRSGAKFTKMIPDLSAQAARLFANEIYNIFYYCKENGKRWLQIEGDEYITAGHRMKGHFLTTAGERIFRIPMGIDEKESFKNLMTAFNNKQKEVYETKDRLDSKASVSSNVRKLKKKLRRS